MQLLPIRKIFALTNKFKLFQSHYSLCCRNKLKYLQNLQKMSLDIHNMTDCRRSSVKSTVHHTFGENLGVSSAYCIGWFALACLTVWIQVQLDNSSFFTGTSCESISNICNSLDWMNFQWCFITQDSGSLMWRTSTNDAVPHLHPPRSLQWSETSINLPLHQSVS